MKKLMYWLPHAWAILFIVAAGIFAFFDSKTFSETLLRLAPSGLAAFALLIALEHEMHGGVAFVISGLLGMLTVHSPLWVYLIIAGIPALIGVLFLLNRKLLPLIENFEKRA